MELRLDKAIFWMVLILVFFLPLIMVYQLSDTFFLPKVTLLRSIVVLVVSFWVFKIIYSRKIEWRHAPLDLPILIFLFVAMLSTVFSINPLMSVVGSSFMRHEALPTWICYLILFFVASNFLTKPKDIFRLLKVLVLAALPISLYGILQGFGYEIFRYKYPFEALRSSSTFGNPVFLGGYLVLILPLALTLFSMESSIRAKLLWALTSLAIVISLFLTYSRGALVGALVSLTFLVILGVSKSSILRRRRQLFSLIVLTLVIISLVVLVSARKIVTEISLMEKITSAIELKGSAAARLSAWRSTLKLIPKRPVLGWGFETLKDVFPLYREKLMVVLEEKPMPTFDRPHSQLLYIAFSMGIIGLVSYLWIIFAYFGHGWKSLKKVLPNERLLLIGIISACLGYLIQEQFSFSIVGVTPLFWILMGLTMNVGLTKENISARRLNLSANSQVLLIVVLMLISIVTMISISRFMVAEYKYTEANRQHLLGREDQANRLLAQAISYNPWDDRYRYGYGESSNSLALKTGDLIWTERAIFLFQEGIRNNPKANELYFGLGNAYYNHSLVKRSPDYSMAKKSYQKAIELEPNFYEAYLWLGMSYLQEGNYDSAIKHLNRSLDISPNQMKALDGLGQAYEKKGEVGKAIKYFKLVLKIDPNYQQAKEDLERLQAR